MKKTLSGFLMLALMGLFAAGCGDVSTCADLCSHTDEATADQGQCVGNYMQTRGYNIWLNPTCNSVDTEQECNACYGDVSANDEHCKGAYDACF